MTDLLREAAQQALEALERLVIGTDYEEAVATETTITALRAALEQPEQTCNCRWVGDVQTQQCTLHEAHVDAIHEWAERAKAAEAKLGQSEQEPVAWMYVGVKHDGTTHGPHLVWKPQYMDAMSASKGAKAAPLYPHPRRREWQSLTDGDIDWICDCHSTLQGAVRAIEAALKERNHG